MGSEAARRQGFMCCSECTLSARVYIRARATPWAQAQVCTHSQTLNELNRDNKACTCPMPFLGPCSCPKQHPAILQKNSTHSARTCTNSYTTKPQHGTLGEASGSTRLALPPAGAAVLRAHTHAQTATQQNHSTHPWVRPAAPSGLPFLPRVLLGALGCARESAWPLA